VTWPARRSWSLKPVSATGTGAKHDPNRVRFEEILNKVNGLFSGEDFTPPDNVPGSKESLPSSWTTTRSRTKRPPTPKSNSWSPRTSPTPSSKQSSAAIPATTRWPEIFFTDDRMKVSLVNLLGQLVQEDLHVEASA
jgi:type I restriction enzyme R subunit